jgi:hypothetical protein
LKSPPFEEYQGDRPSPRALVGGELRVRRARDERERRLAGPQVGDHAVGDLVDRRGAARAALVPLGVEHEVLDDELAPALEDVEQGHLAVLTGEDVVLVDAHHRHPAAIGVQGILDARQLLLALEKCAAGGEPLLSGGDLGQTHVISSGRHGKCATRGVGRADAAKLIGPSAPGVSGMTDAHPAGR